MRERILLPALIAAVSCAGTLWSGVAMAGARKAAPIKEGLTSDSYYWRVTIAGDTVEVAAGGTVKYCKSQPVESLSPIIDLHVSSGDPRQKHWYVERIFGPKSAGRSTANERVLDGRSTVSEETFGPNQFFVLERTSDTPSFPAGTYRAQVNSRIGRELQGRERTTTELLKLSPRAGC